MGEKITGTNDFAACSRKIIWTVGAKNNWKNALQPVPVRRFSFSVKAQIKKTRIISAFRVLGPLRPTPLRNFFCLGFSCIYREKRPQKKTTCGVRAFGEGSWRGVSGEIPYVYAFFRGLIFFCLWTWWEMRGVPARWRDPKFPVLSWQVEKSPPPSFIRFFPSEIANLRSTFTKNFTSAGLAAPTKWNSGPRQSFVPERGIRPGFRTPQLVHHPHKNHSEHRTCKRVGGVYFAVLLGSDNPYTIPSKRPLLIRGPLWVWSMVGALLWEDMNYAPTTSFSERNQGHRAKNSEVLVAWFARIVRIEWFVRIGLTRY